MKPRLTILTEIIAPYRIPIFNALASRGDIDPHVIFLSENDPSLRQWRVEKAEITFSYEVLSSRRYRIAGHNILLNSGVAAALCAARPDAILCGGYNYLASWTAARWAKHNEVPLLLWSESTINDARGQRGLVESLKRHFRRYCTAFVAAGQSSRSYLISLGEAPEKIFVAPNAVDVDAFAAIAAGARKSHTAIRAQFRLPERFFLYVGRLVGEKGVFDLLSAYRQLDESIRSRISLVLVGDGPARSELARLASELESVYFTGFLQKEETPKVYALAEALILPTHSDTWGLVVNEAMACNLPVVVSSVAGCAADLVIDGTTGYQFSAHDVASLAGILRRWCDTPESTVTMGSASFRHIQSFTPTHWAAGVATAVQNVLGRRG